MSIKQTRYVDIASAVIGASTAPMRKLTARIFSTNPKIPAGKVLEFASGQVDDLLGTDSPEAHFARQYFSYVSPAPASKPKELQIASYEPVGRAPTLFGEKTGDLADLKLINEGELNITIGKVTKTITGIDLSESTSYADVATAVQAKLNAESEPQFASAYVTFNSLDSAFVISGGVQERADIS
ncbi:DUF3383 family protein, partial [Proteus mirabilis]